MKVSDTSKRTYGLWSIGVHVQGMKVPTKTSSVYPFDGNVVPRPSAVHHCFVAHYNRTYNGLNLRAVIYRKPETAALNSCLLTVQ